MSPRCPQASLEGHLTEGTFREKVRKGLERQAEYYRIKRV